MVEAKEGCPLSADREQLGRLTYQRFFSRYMRLGAMSGTAREVHSELWSVYGLGVRRIPLHRPSRRLKLPAVIYSRAREKWAAVISSVVKMQALGRPVLIGTGSVADSELLSRKLTTEGIAHQVLNARQDEKEAQIVADAGKQRQVTVATNMAGRGTDIPLGDGVAELGGLHVIAACRNDAKRIDRQLFGRCARQGDPGSYQVMLSWQDEWVLNNRPPAPIGLLCRLTSGGAPFQCKLNSTIIRRTQRKLEQRHRRARRALLKHDRQTGRMLAFSGHME
jgi:preprotein translocase subunit SecA